MWPAIPSSNPNCPEQAEGSGQTLLAVPPFVLDVPKWKRAEASEGTVSSSPSGWSVRWGELQMELA